MLRMLLGATKVDGNDIPEDVLPQPLDTAEALKELNTRLEDDQYRRKIVASLFKKKSFYLGRNFILI